MAAAGMTSGGPAAATGTFESYEMSDHDGDTSESESDDEEMRERSRRAAKKVWRYFNERGCPPCVVCGFLV